MSAVGCRRRAHTRAGIEHLVFILDLRLLIVYMSEQKVMQLKQMGQELIQQRHAAPDRLFEKMSGMLGSFRTAYPEDVGPARGMMHCIQHLPSEW